MLTVLPRGRLRKDEASDLARVEQLLASQEARMRREVRRFLDNVRSSRIVGRVRDMLEQERIDEVLDLVDSHVERLGSAATDVFREAGAHEAETLSQQLGAAGSDVAISFDPSDPRAAEKMRQNRLQLVREFGSEQRRVTRDALVRALETGQGPAAAAQEFRDSIGLTEYQRGVVANYRQLLENRDYQAALGRELRDRRSDRRLERLAGEARLLGDREALGQDTISRMTDRYRERMVKKRAETIARTETRRTVGAAREEAMQQAMEEASVPSEDLVRVWRATADERTRFTHRSMDGQERDRDTPFDSPMGARLRYPGDPSAPAEETVNCRCVVVHRIADPDD